MPNIDPNIVNKLKKKATQSTAHHKIAAFGFNSAGECVCKSTNKPSEKPEVGSHAEERIFKHAKRLGIKRILICRIGFTGFNTLRPIDPCEKCQKIANKLGIKIESVPAEEI